MIERIFYGLLGALIGAGIGASGSWWLMDVVSLPITAGLSALCGLLAAWGGESVLKALWKVLEEVF